MTTVEKIRAMAAVLKRHFPNLNVDKTLEISGELLAAIGEEQ